MKNKNLHPFEFYKISKKNLKKTRGRSGRHIKITCETLVNSLSPIRDKVFNFFKEVFEPIEKKSGTPRPRNHNIIHFG